QWTHFKLFAPKGSGDYSMGRYNSEIKRLYEVLETRLGKVPYLGGQEYSIADIATYPWTRNHDTQGVKWEDNPNLARWFNAINERPAVKAALAKVGAIKSNRETASDDQKDRFFNRGRYARAGSSREETLGEGALNLEGKAAVVTGSSSDGGVVGECAK